MSSSNNNEILNIDGERQSGSEVRASNVTACIAVANIVRTSLGPTGLDKMLVSDKGTVVTNDGATILRMLDIQHPAAKMLVEVAQLQDEEIGDGTTSVVLIAAELLRRANELVKHKIHPTSIISGFRLASTEACRYINETLCVRTDTLRRDTLMGVASTTLSSKIIGAASSHFSTLAVDALLRVRVDPESPGARPKYPLSSVSVLKAPGGGLTDSHLVDGVALNCTKSHASMPRSVANAKLCLLDVNLMRGRMPQGVTIELRDPLQMNMFQDKESDIVRDVCKTIIASGATVVMTTKGIDDIAGSYFADAGVLGVRRCRKEDLRLIARATGAEFLQSLSDLDGNVTVPSSALGTAARVSQESLGDNELIFIRGVPSPTVSSVLLRGPNELMLDEMERAFHDALSIVRKTLESGAVVAGGGAVEAALSIYLENFATTLGSREQLAIAEFAEALLVIPKALAVNAAKDAADLVAKLRAHHNASQMSEGKKELAFSGLDLENGVVRNNLAAGVLEPALSKTKSLQFATEAAITILRIDEMFKLNPKRRPQNEDDDD